MKKIKKIKWDDGYKLMNLLNLPRKRWIGNCFGYVMKHSIGYKVPRSVLIDDIDQMIIINDIAFGIEWPFPAHCNVWHMNESSARII